MIRCNNCMRLFEDDSELEWFDDYFYDIDETFQGCPDCETDEYLMDLNDSKENA